MSGDSVGPLQERVLKVVEGAGGLPMSLLIPQIVAGRPAVAGIPGPRRAPGCRILPMGGALEQVSGSWSPYPSCREESMSGFLIDCPPSTL